MDLFHLHHGPIGNEVTHQDVTSTIHDHSSLTDPSDLASAHHVNVLGSHSDVPWLNFGPSAAHHDTDHDGIPDALDHSVGPGADPQILGTHSDTPWIHFGMDAAHHDADHDGIPDALDHHVGPGAEPQILGTHPDVPWMTFGPDAMHHDTDGDGIPDALDHRVGPGAE